MKKQDKFQDTKSKKAHSRKTLIFAFYGYVLFRGINYTLLAFSFILVALMSITDDFRIYLAIRTGVLIMVICLIFKKTKMQSSKHCQMSDIWQNCPVPLAMCLLGKFPKTLFCFWQIGYDNNRNDFEKNRLTEAGKKLTSVGGRKQRFYISFRYLKSAWR